ncbi:MAG: universal stress protein [bacterium]
MHSHELAHTLPELGVRATHASPIIIATDGRAQSDSALVIGRLLADTPNSLRLVSVIKTMPVIPETSIAVSADFELVRRAGIEAEIITQVHRAWNDDTDFEVCDGDPAAVISQMAHESGATMIVAGLGRHRVADRIFGDETALRLIRMSDVPVFAAAKGVTQAPRRIVVAIDFTETSLRAARMALEVGSFHSTVYLVHVAPRRNSLPDWEGWGTAYKQDAAESLKKTRSQLHVPDDMTIHDVLLQGDPGTELLSFATSVDADLIATGSHGDGFITRMLIGSVTTQIVRGSTCSVLTVPYTAVMTPGRV